jgi:diguanylate cyclase (GGDEF)-like protein
MIDSDSEAGEPAGAATGHVRAWGTRAFICDATGGFLSLRGQIKEEMGSELAADILCRAGTSEANVLMAFVAQTHSQSDGVVQLEHALSLLTEAGYGRLSLETGRHRDGEIIIYAEDSMIGSTLRDLGEPAGFGCDYLRGLLRGVVQGLPPVEGYPSGDIECVEVRCLVNDDPECRFVIASSEHLAQHGYRVGDKSYSSVRETLMRLNRQLEDVLEAAKRDSLTGLYNRAHFESVLRHKIEHANRRTDTLTVAMIDIDGFKGVNDTLGHGMGDLALRQVGHLLASNARGTDVVARYGGDEFAWLMPGTTVEAALFVADRIRRLVQEMREEIDLPVSLSVGVAACPEDAASLTDLIDFADAAMYLAKDSGGNQVRRYVAAEDHRTASQKRVRRPRPRISPTATKSAPLPPDDTGLRLDLSD